jgi:hypothetical protein
MEETKKTNGNSKKNMVCDCHGCGESRCCGGEGYLRSRCGSYGSYHGGHGILRIILGIIILVFVFWAGVRLGELKAYFGGYGNHAMFGKMMIRDYDANRSPYCLDPDITNDKAIRSL